MTEHEYKSIASISQLTLGTALAVTLGGGKPRLCAVSISCWIGLQKWGGGGKVFSTCTVWLIAF